MPLHVDDDLFRRATEESPDDTTEKTEAMNIRPETAADHEAVYRVVAEAFPSDAEARLVNALRGKAEPWISLVAEDDAGEVIGHILFTGVTIRSESGSSQAMGLAPMAVLPRCQRQGVGTALVKAGLEACREAGEPVVVVLGHPSYYPRFGFRPAWDAGLYFQTPGPNPAFMVRELEAGALAGRRGEVRYHPVFGQLSEEAEMTGSP